jgi:hypothetical protein
MPLLLATGHQRSGTTILRILLNSHPEIAMTNEFNLYRHVGRSKVYYSSYLLRRIWVLRSRRDIFAPHSNQPSPWWDNPVSIGKYLVHIQWPPAWRVSYRDVESAFRSILPKRKWVGDKVPDYIWQLPRYAGSDALHCIVIYRDGRDVVSSSLESARTAWKNKKYARHFDTAEKVATRWVRAIERMEECADKILILRYEQLISEPKQVMQKVGAWLDVDPAGFPIQIIRDTSIGKHKSMLTKEELGVFMDIAGSTLSRLGYK